MNFPWKTIYSLRALKEFLVYIPVLSTVDCGARNLVSDRTTSCVCNSTVTKSNHLDYDRTYEYVAGTGCSFAREPFSVNLFAPDPSVLRFPRLRRVAWQFLTASYYNAKTMVDGVFVCIMCWTVLGYFIHVFRPYRKKRILNRSSR